MMKRRGIVQIVKVFNRGRKTFTRSIKFCNEGDKIIKKKKYSEKINCREKIVIKSIKENQKKR